MSLENYTGNISDLVATNPTGTDPRSQGDDHLRGIKYTLKQSFPLATGPVRVSGDKLFAGDSADQTKNFVIDASADNGTMKLARESGQDIITVDASGKVAFPQTSVIVRAAGSTQSIANGGSSVAVTFTQEFQDTNNAWNGTKFQPTIAGVYQIEAQLGYVAGAAVGQRSCSIRRNGTDLRASGVQYANNSEAYLVYASTIVPFNGTTDYVEVIAYQNSGAALSLDSLVNNTFFNAHRVGD